MFHVKHARGEAHIFPHSKTIIPPHVLAVKSFHEISIIHFYEYDYAATTFAQVNGLSE